MRSAFQKKLMKPKEVMKLDNTINEVLFLLSPRAPGNLGGKKSRLRGSVCWVAAGLLCGGNAVSSYSEIAPGIMSCKQIIRVRSNVSPHSSQGLGVVLGVSTGKLY